MKIKAKIDIAGLVTMKKGETRNVRKGIAVELIEHGYVEEIKEKKEAESP